MIYFPDINYCTKLKEINCSYNKLLSLPNLNNCH